MNWEEEEEAVVGQKFYGARRVVSEAQLEFAFSKSLQLSGKFSFGESGLVTFINDQKYACNTAA
jgi:hypothetical protein